MDKVHVSTQVTTHSFQQRKRVINTCSLLHIICFIFVACSREAELAIRELNNAPPFYFRVQFARSAAEKERIRKERQDEELLRRVLDSEPYPIQAERFPVPFNR
jgi:hypothetical protein